MERDQLLIEKLKKYADTDAYPFHMPGHKRQAAAGGFPDPFSIDITEIDGFDNLHHPEGILKESMEWAAKVYGSDKTYYMINGSSGGILSAVFATVRHGGTILMSRNSHKSAYHGVILNHLKKVDVYPHVIDELGISGGILPEDVDKLLTENSDTEAVFLVSPTYDGVVSDIAGIADVVHRRGIPLIVDEAHGAHFSFGAGVFPESALQCGADIVIQSVHKTLPSLTQTAVLHVRKGFVDVARLEKYLQMFQSSSPSYILMASIEACIFEMNQNGADIYSRFMERMADLRRELRVLKRIRLLDRSFCGKDGVFDVDESKMVISVKDCFRDGVWLSGILRDRYHLEMEMAGADYVLAIATCFDTEQGLERLKQALLEIDENVGLQEEKNPMHGWEMPIKVMELAEASDCEWEEKRLAECEGKVSAEFIYLYPPGIPIVAPGEMITKKIISRVQDYKEKGFPVQGMADERADLLRVVKRNQ